MNACAYNLLHLGKYYNYPFISMQCSWRQALRRKFKNVAVRMTRGTLHAACYDHGYVIHAIVPARARAVPKIVLVPPYLSIYLFVCTWMIIVLFIVDTLVSTIGLPPLQNGRRHFSPLILHLEWTAILTRLLRGPYLDLETPLIPLE